jgi:hypothetical protein
MLWLKEPGRIIERIAPGREEDRLDRGEGPADSWAHGGSQAAYKLPVALLTRRYLSGCGVSAGIYVGETVWRRL